MLQCAMGGESAEHHVTPSPPEQSDPGPRRGPAGTLLKQALTRALWSIFWERLWPALAALATAVGLFLAVSWLGLWLWLPTIARAAGLFVFAVVGVGAM